uniref:Protein dead ringer homolog n=1 Tax=Ciona intestinalis TaxID=7719 RepID=DRI_CIOIN|nr:protein dead ringer homolog [Ciona intestinalis]Q4H3P5.1 RecName: Full=Protein dead ringer homolog [Ciona intestinalis]BAE06382.1 dead ringer homolog [Ciona intestinalis]|eukprot:NP_001071682.1 protein dead ringer homolog [Ciona intestinalis]
MMLSNISQTKAELLSGLGSSLTSSPGNVSAATMKLEAVMENLQRQHQQRMMEQHKNDDVISNDVRCDDFSDGGERQRSYSGSPKEDSDEDRNDMTSPMMRDDDDVMQSDGRSPEPDKTSLITQQMAFAAALAQRSSPDGSLSSLVPQAMMQHFGQFPASFDASQLPQGFRELAMLQHQHVAQRMAMEAQKRMQQDHNIQQSTNHIPTPSSASSHTSSGSVTSQTNSCNGSQQEWTYEEQFKQLYEIDDDIKRKEFLDDLFSFMQKRGTPVNRIPIMAKQVLDLYQLYRLVVEKGGLVEVINKKIWREITKGLNLPSSITSAAFTLRTQYMKYLYPFECEREKLSVPSELQAAIEGNRREGRRPSYSSHMFSYSPNTSANMLTPPKFPFAHHNGLAQLSQMAAAKYGQPDERCLPTSPTQQLIAQQQQLLQSANAQHVAAMAALETIQNQAKARQAAQQAAHHAAQQAAQHQMSLKKEIDSDYSEGEPPEKKLSFDDSVRRLTPDNQRRSSTSSLKISMGDRGRHNEMSDVTNADSINICVEVNGITYQGVLFAHSPNHPPVKHVTLDHPTS